MGKRLATALFPFLFAALPSFAGDQTPKIPSSIVAKQVNKLTHKVQWHDSLPEALDKARRENKLVLWLHALGDLDGTT
jgi:hypothetical protein